MGVEVTLSKVSVNERRAPIDFRRALQAIQDFYRVLLSCNLPKGQQVQLFCVLALDVPVKFAGQEATSLIELEPIWVSGSHVV